MGYGRELLMAEGKISVRLRGGFSDRNNIKAENTTIQLKDLDSRTRVALINITNELYTAETERISEETKQRFFKRLLKSVFLFEIDEHGYYSSERVFQLINATIRTENYDSVLTLIEYISNEFNEFRKYDTKKADYFYNNIFKKEYVGYRIINGIIVPITNDEEQESIEIASNTKHSKVNDFFIKASRLISDRKKPDYENAIKESISAVEEACNTILGNRDSLGAALKKLETKGIEIHPSLKSAFDKLYGYTSDASGIRHAGQLGGKSATFEEARFMLVACSAFVNYLLSNYQKYKK